ncbi:Obg-like ATPase 1 [Aduncisulcus paluster]|uniref:Obg-like ATPase 1 n=1 Tax=Aduncisulcus paluster TaxID=2918883 RepID=A0ABQ5KZQ1_9EUKA|nr:Obg-like ATPase 1 [Aduncisulcus paluster]
MAKKIVEEESFPLLGRCKNRLSMGLVGLPNVGKSLIFNCLTKCEVPSENFPFCTIDPHVARVNVPDPRYEHLVEKYKPKSRVPAFLEVTDIAGLVKGASEGAGLGNAFLSNIAAVDGIFHVVRAFKDPTVTHVEGDVNPTRDMEIIHSELRAKDLQNVKARVEEAERIIRCGIDKKQKFVLEVLEKCVTCLESGKDIRNGEWKASDIEVINDCHFLTAKPVIYLINMSEKGYLKKKCKYLKDIVEWVAAHGAHPLIPFCASFEAKLLDMNPDDAKKALAEAKTISQIERMILEGRRQLHLIQFFTAGTDEVKSWTIREGTKAPQAGGVIHTDFEKGFICAEIMSFEDFERCGGETQVKAEGKYLQQGKTYKVKDGDIIYFKAGKVNKGKK